MRTKVGFFKLEFNVNIKNTKSVNPEKHVDSSWHKSDDEYKPDCENVIFIDVRIFSSQYFQSFESGIKSWYANKSHEKWFPVLWYVNFSFNLRNIR